MLPKVELKLCESSRKLSCESEICKEALEMLYSRGIKGAAHQGQFSAHTTPQHVITRATVLIIGQWIHPSFTQNGLS